MSEQLSFSVVGSLVSPIRVPTDHFPVIQQPPVWASLALQQLSPREQEVLAFLALRWTDREISEVLCISYRTVTTHVSNIFDKLGINSRREAAAFALLADNVSY